MMENRRDKEKAISAGAAVGFFASVFQWLTKPSKIDVYVHLSDEQVARIVSNLKIEVSIPQVTVNVPTIHVESSGPQAQSGQQSAECRSSAFTQAERSTADISGAGAEAQKLSDLEGKLSGKLGTPKVQFGQESS